MARGNRINVDALYILGRLADKRKAVTGESGVFARRPLPAVFVLNMPGAIILRLVREGLYEHVREEKK